VHTVIHSKHQFLITLGNTIPENKGFECTNGNNNIESRFPNQGFSISFGFRKYTVICPNKSVHIIIKTKKVLIALKLSFFLNYSQIKNTVPILIKF